MHTAMPKTFEELRSAIWEEKQATLEILCERLSELSRFEQGSYFGQVMAYDEVLGVLRNSIKYGDVE